MSKDLTIKVWQACLLPLVFFSRLESPESPRCVVPSSERSSSVSPPAVQNFSQVELCETVLRGVGSLGWDPHRNNGPRRRWATVAQQHAQTCLFNNKPITLACSSPTSGKPLATTAFRPLRHRNGNLDPSLNPIHPILNTNIRKNKNPRRWSHRRSEGPVLGQPPRLTSPPSRPPG